MNRSPNHDNTKKLVHDFLRSLGGEPLSVPDNTWAKRNQVASAFGSQTEFHQVFWKAVRELEAKLAQAALDHVYIKTVRTFPSDDSNIDVVFRTEEDFQRARSLAESSGRTATYSYHEPDKVMYRLYDGPNEKKPAWHFHRGVTWNGVSYLRTNEVFADRRRVEHEGIVLDVPSASHALLIYAGHALFENYIIPLGELYDVSVLSLEIPDWEAIYLAARQNGWEKALKAYIWLVKGILRDLEVLNALPGSASSWSQSFTLPFRVPWKLEVRAFVDRISYNVKTRQYRQALRELYAYPLFFALEQGKMFFGYA